MPEAASALVVGSGDDPHAAAVTDRLAAWDVRAFLVDAASLAASRFAVSPGSARIWAASGRPVTLSAGTRGWLRRVVPANWQRGVAVGSRQAAIGAAWLALLGGILRSGTIQWLSALDRVVAAENKLVQYRAALELAIPAPATVVAGDVADVVAMLGERFVVKPLGPGQFFADDNALAVFTRELTADDPALADLGGAPFLAQQRLRAERHLRVVTVAQRAWVCALDADGLDLDWRRTAAAHRQFHRVQEPAVAAAALRLASALEVGYSSQDWVVCDGQAWFVDLNPAGQWLFLPDPTAAEVTTAIAAWLAGRR